MSLRAAFLLCAAALVTACGQTGPLYLPDRGGDVVTRPAGQTPPPDGGAAQQSPSTEGAPQPSTQTPESSTNKPDKKPESAPR
jgi:predicted small lipoprotein YifL